MIESGRTHRLERSTIRPSLLVYMAAGLSLVAALIHLWVTPAHFEEWRGYGLFFLLTAISQGTYCAALLCWPRRGLLLLGAVGNLLVMGLYLLSWTVGIPLFGPHAGEVEAVGVAGLCATASELALLTVLGVSLLRGLSRERVSLVLLIIGMALLFVGHPLHLLLSGSQAHH